MNITKTLVNWQITEAIERETRPDHGNDWARRYLTAEAVQAFMELTEEERRDALKALDAVPYSPDAFMRGVE